MNSGTGLFASTLIDLTGTSSLTNNGGTVSGPIQVSSGTLTLLQTTAGGATGSASYSNVFSGGGALTVSTDADKSVTLSGANTYTGTTTVNAGTLTLTGSITSNVTNNATFNNTGGTVTGTVSSTAGTFANTGIVTGAVSISGGTATNTGTLQNTLLVTGGTFTNNTNGTVQGTTTNNGGTITGAGGTFAGVTNTTGTFNLNAGSTGTVSNAATFNIGGTSGTTGTFTTTAAGSRLLVNTGTYTVSGLVTNSGTNALGGILVAAGATLTATAGGITNNAGATIVNNGTINDTLNNSGTVTNNLTYNANVATNTGTITNSATGTWTGNVTSNTSSATGITNNGIWVGNVVANTGTIVNNLTWTGTVSNTFVFTNNAPGTISGLVTNTGSGTFTTTGTLSNGLTNAGVANAQGTINGPIANNAGGINVTGALVGNSTFNNAATANMNINNQSFTGSTTYTNVGTTNLTAGGLLSATAITNSGTFINGGTTTGTFTMSAGNLSGTGNTQSLTVNGGTFAPGNGTAGTSMTVTGSLLLQAAATYLVQINPTTASFTSVTGAATLGGATVSANFAAGSYVSKTYTLVTAAGGVTGTFGALATTGQPGSVTSALSYDATHAYLNLTLSFGLPGGLNQNQQNVANALTGFFNRTGGIPGAFASLTPGQLTQSDGEHATGVQQSTISGMSLFVGLMTDISVEGRGNPAPAGGAVRHAYASEDTPRSPAVRDAYAAIYRKAPVAADPFVQRWSVWAAGYGGSQTTSGNAVVGSNNTSSNLYGVAVGADYRLSPDTLAGFALAGGGTSFNVANGLGSGRSDLFQAGAFVRHNMGAAYLSGALAYGWQDITTNRTLTIAGIDQLQAKFNANAWSGHVEGGYRFVAPGLAIGLTPYAAGQFTTFDLPAYAEHVIAGANTFALAYGAKSVTATRSELGLRTDKSFATEDGVFTLRGRAAWAHDYNPDRSIGATFQTLPGASFVVNGARMASDAVLLTASAEKKWLNGWSASGTFEGEFSSVTTSYAGKGVVRYSW